MIPMATPRPDNNVRHPAIAGRCNRDLRGVITPAMRPGATRT